MRRGGANTIGWQQELMPVESSCVRHPPVIEDVDNRVKGGAEHREFGGVAAALVNRRRFLYHHVLT
jgi:hypothetical protein